MEIAVYFLAFFVAFAMALIWFNPFTLVYLFGTSMVFGFSIAKARY